MKRTDKNLTLLNTIFVAALITANVVTAKTIPLGLRLFGAEIVIPGAVLCYAMTFLVTDIIGEIWGRHQANITVRNGFVCQVLSTVLITFTGYLPASDPAMQDAYMSVLGQNYMFVVASLLAYVCSQSWDVWLFHRIRARYISKHAGERRGRWIWNNASTMTSQIIDTVIFIGVGFGFGLGWFFDAAMLPTLFAMMIGQYAVKFVLAVLDTPFFYLLTRHNEDEDMERTGALHVE